jgi:hypothetical protein
MKVTVRELVAALGQALADAPTHCSVAVKTRRDGTITRTISTGSRPGGYDVRDFYAQKVDVFGEEPK